MLTITRRVLLRTEPKFCVDVLRSDDSVWVRLTTWPDGAVRRFWSRPRASVGDVDIDALIDLVESALLAAPPQAVANQSAMDLWPEGWDFWPGIPGPLSEEVLKSAFAEMVAKVEPSAR